MEKFVPNWAVWISFSIFCIIGVGYIIWALMLFRGLETEGIGFVIGELIGAALMIYLLIYIPARIMYEYYLKKK